MKRNVEEPPYAIAIVGGWQNCGLTIHPTSNIKYSFGSE
jgi:hypothetical protein